MNLNTPSIAPIAITVGEPAGIGPEVSLRAAMQWQQSHKVPVTIIGDCEHLGTTAERMALDISSLNIQHIALNAPVRAGKLNPANAPYVLALLNRAIEGTVSGEFSAMVTAPVQKSVINEAVIGHKFTGHTEYLAEKTNSPQVVMMLAGGGLRVALATTHLSLAEVPSNITHDTLTTTIRIILHDLQNKFGIRQPRLLVAGLNPHAGEGGHMGREEIDIITPVIQLFQAQGHDVSGPYPADTLFQPRYLNNADAILTMFHDQGLPVLKFASFGKGVNITLGLPMIRTSVDHGTALDLAGKNQADAGSMYAAIQCAYDMAIEQRKLL